MTTRVVGCGPARGVGSGRSTQVILTTIQRTEHPVRRNSNLEKNRMLVLHIELKDQWSAGVSPNMDSCPTR